MIEIGVYKHYKGNLYSVVFVGKHSETLEDMVVYKALYNSPEFGNNAVWIRPVSSFTSQVEVNGEKVPRFKKI
jgi:hypothetical protein